MNRAVTLIRRAWTNVIPVTVFWSADLSGDVAEDAGVNSEACPWRSHNPESRLRPDAREYLLKNQGFQHTINNQIEKL